MIKEYQEKIRIISVYQEFFRLKEKKRGIALSLEKRVMGLPDYGQMKESHKVLAADYTTHQQRDFIVDKKD